LKNIRVIQTAKDTGDRLTEQSAIMPEVIASAKIVLKPERTYQKVLGFGGAFTEAAAYAYSRMMPELREEILRKYFDPREGIGYSIGRIHMNSCDFSLGNYTYVGDKDENLETFDISREAEWVIPFIMEAAAVKGESIKFLVSPWSPPGWMKTNGEMNNGGKLLPQYREAWARYYVKFIKAMRSKGVDIRAVTIQNEPAATQVWDSCIWSAEEEGLFIRDYLGPVFEEEGLSDIRIYFWDHNRDIIVDRAAGTMLVQGAGRYIYGIADHWCCSEEFGNLSKVHKMFPNLHFLFSEGCPEGGVQLGSWHTGERYGRNIIGEFNNWQEGFIDWNLVLDETGGPNHVGNLCDAAIIADTKEQKLYYNSSYYYIGQFSKFVMPGAVRIGTEYAADAASVLKQAAFMNPDGSVVMVVMNETDNEESFAAELGEDSVAYTMPQHSIATFIFGK
jgi:glucosylceramidase